MTNKAVLPIEGRKIKILHIDEENYIRKIVRQILPADNFSIDSVEDGKQALMILEKKQFDYDLVITEMHLKYASGFEIINAIGERSNPAIPIIITSNLSYFHIERSVTTVRENYFKKPFVVGGLLARVKILVRQDNLKVPDFPIEEPAYDKITLPEFYEEVDDHANLVGVEEVPFYNTTQAPFPDQWW